MVGESGIKANSAQFSWSLAELGNKSVLYLRFVLIFLSARDGLNQRNMISIELY